MLLSKLMHRHKKTRRCLRHPLVLESWVEDGIRTALAVEPIPKKKKRRAKARAIKRNPIGSTLQKNPHFNHIAEQAP